MPTLFLLRLALWARTLARFFPFVRAFVVVLLLTGYAMIGQGVPQTLPVRAMTGIGWLMFVLFAYLSLRLLPALKRGVAAGDVPAAAKAMDTMRPLMGDQSRARDRGHRHRHVDAVPALTPLPFIRS